jgi:hypothetical protein
MAGTTMQSFVSHQIQLSACYNLVLPNSNTLIKSSSNGAQYVTQQNKIG